MKLAFDVSIFWYCYGICQFEYASFGKCYMWGLFEMRICL